ncbi:MAG TPA: hypothetical protein VE733_28650 [Streptosporangiaceae bacterium]|jgi:hypothetical protein|nr:hypothetical protein [Streptosporangiaceae bacterium]
MLQPGQESIPVCTGTMQMKFHMTCRQKLEIAGRYCAHSSLQCGFGQMGDVDAVMFWRRAFALWRH